MTTPEIAAHDASASASPVREDVGGEALLRRAQQVALERFIVEALKWSKIEGGAGKAKVYREYAEALRSALATPPSQPGVMDAQTAEAAFIEGVKWERLRRAVPDSPSDLPRAAREYANADAVLQSIVAAPAEQAKGDAKPPTNTALAFAFIADMAGDGSSTMASIREFALKHMRLARAASMAQADAEPVVFEMTWPDYHYQGMGCGLEDRGIRDRYEAMRYGWDCAIDACAERLPEKLYEEPPAPRPAMCEGNIRATLNDLIRAADNAAETINTSVMDSAIAAARDALAQPVSDDTRDAERYRTLRNWPAHKDTLRFELWVGSGRFDNAVYGDAMDEQVDGVIARQAGRGVE